MSTLLQALGERRDIISNDLETMRDSLGFPICWDPSTGSYRLGKNPDAGQPTPGGGDLALLYRAIAFEEYLYVTFRTACAPAENYRMGVAWSDCRACPCADTTTPLARPAGRAQEWRGALCSRTQRANVASSIWPAATASTVSVASA
jgi:hypothetical protein